MKYTLIVFIAFLLSPVTMIHAADASKSVARPNIIFLLADDSGFADFGCYGHPYARTPNIDKLAADGTRFTQFYANGVTCCPSRTGWMTSKFPATFATYPANGGFGNRITITELLQQQGYATGHFGKWHIGRKQTNGIYGIDSVGADDGAEGKKRQSASGRDAHIYDDAIKFIEKHKDGPFYVNIWGHISHHPVNPPQSYLDKFQDIVVDETKFSVPMREKFARCKQLGGDVSEHMRRYLADLYSLDEDVGRLLKRLDELGLRESTIVVFSSDQGPADIRLATDDDKAKKKKDKPAVGNNVTDSRLNAMGYTGELRGGKHGMYEGGVHVPFIIRWPNNVPAGRVDEQSVISGIDWLPTLCHIVGAKIDANDFDGENVSAAWLGNNHTRTKSLLWKTSAPNSDAGIRDGQWKLIHPTRKRGEVELYDIVADAGEKHNVAQQHPDVVKNLSAKVETWARTLPKEYLKQGDKND